MFALSKRWAGDILLQKLAPCAQLISYIRTGIAWSQDASDIRDSASEYVLMRCNRWCMARKRSDLQSFPSYLLTLLCEYVLFPYLWAAIEMVTGIGYCGCEVESTHLAYNESFQTASSTPFKSKVGK